MIYLFSYVAIGFTASCVYYLDCRHKEMPHENASFEAGLVFIFWPFSIFLFMGKVMDWVYKKLGDMV